MNVAEAGYRWLPLDTTIKAMISPRCYCARELSYYPCAWTGV